MRPPKTVAACCRFRSESNDFFYASPQFLSLSFHQRNQMKVANPSSRTKLTIPRKAMVLDVGSGHNPHPRANVITDKFTESNYHRRADIKVLSHQRFVEASGESLPFGDKEFDYVICCHVVEHVDDPAV